MTADYTLWNALVSTATLVVVAVAAFAALRQLRHLRAQTSIAAFLKILDDWRDPAFQETMQWVRFELPRRVADPAFLASLDQRAVDRTMHPELAVCDWFEQVGSYVKYGLLDERVWLDASSGAIIPTWTSLEPVITRMRRTRDDRLYENFEYVAVRCVLFERAHPKGCYPQGTPRMADLHVGAQNGSVPPSVPAQSPAEPEREAV